MLASGNDQIGVGEMALEYFFKGLSVLVVLAGIYSASISWPAPAGDPVEVAQCETARLQEMLNPTTTLPPRTCAGSMPPELRQAQMRWALGFAGAALIGASFLFWMGEMLSHSRGTRDKLRELVDLEYSRRSAEAKRQAVGEAGTPPELAPFKHT
ncbi:hypothetical protein [Dongia sp.]|uniref:hypothetical protein n=1 Tax=Dongia sp. TaxID=1977262 RepID=UPI0035AD7AEB